MIASMTPVVFASTVEFLISAVCMGGVPVTGHDSL